jgi:hypothetical protein
MVVDDVEDDGEPELMGGIDERAEVVGRSIRAKGKTPSYPQPKRPGNSATGITSSMVMPVSASDGSFSAALFHVPPRVKVPTCIS